MAHVPSRRSFAEVQRLAAYHELLPQLAEKLTQLCAAGDAERPRKLSRSVFEGTEPAPTSVTDYLVRICKYGHCSKWVFITMYVFIDRYQANTGVVLSSHNIHRLVLTSFVVAAKLRDDVYYANKYYASVGGVSLKDMNCMEAALLYQMDWNLHVDKSDYEQYVELLEGFGAERARQMAVQQQPTTVQQQEDVTAQQAPARREPAQPRAHPATSAAPVALGLAAVSSAGAAARPGGGDSARRLIARDGCGEPAGAKKTAAPLPPPPAKVAVELAPDVDDLGAGPMTLLAAKA